MNLVSIQFWILVILTIIVCNIMDKKESRLVVIGIASFIFYAYWDIRFFAMLLLYCFLIYGGAILVEKKKRGICGIIIVLSLLMLGKRQIASTF